MSRHRSSPAAVRGPSTRCLLAAAFLILLLVPPLHAARSWLSKARTPEGGKATSARTVFDVTLSLHNSPSGDDDPDNDTGSEEQTKYENIIRFWADAVCEESNGSHHLGKVRIFRDGRFTGLADVVWSASQHPSANTSGFGAPGMHIYFGDTFPGGSGGGVDKDMLADAEGAGYTLGHEWGHYVYGLYDEYVGKNATGRITQPRSGDTAVDQSIMNSQWRARGGHFNWLNHSTSNNYQANTAQGRAYGASGWEVLVRESDDDPRDGDREALPERTQYTSLTALAPAAADNWFRIELPAEREACRGDLEIVWLAENLALQLVIDRSGSMYGTPLANAQQAGRSLVDAVPGGETALGLVSFNHDVTQNRPITPIPDPGTAERTAMKTAIDRLQADGFTAMFDAAGTALANLSAYLDPGGEVPNRIVFLLSDGLDNSSHITEADVIRRYQAADVPLVTFGYGLFAPTGVLRRLADGTGGRFYSSPVSAAEILSSFLEAVTEFSPTLGIAAGEDTAPPLVSNAVLRTFVVDGTLSALNVFATYPQPPGAFSLALRRPDGAAGPAFSCSTVSGATTCGATADLAALAPAERLGAWSLTATNDNSISVPVKVAVLANPGDERPYDLTLDTLEGGSVTYPEPIVVTATVSKELPITGLNLQATITAPDGTRRGVPMNDDGMEGDGIAGDGVYSVILGYEADGVHTLSVTFDNGAGTARFSVQGLLLSVGEDGVEPQIPAFPPLTENFQRTANLRITVTGLAASGGDDHPDSPPGTPMAANNADVPGRIDRAGDTDYFLIQGVQPQAPLVVRVANLALGMKPRLTLFRADGFTQIAQVDLAGGASPRGYVLATLTPADLDSSGVLVARVEAADGAAGGFYEISAGSRLASDQPAAGACVPGATTLCLRQDRFAVEVEWEDFDGHQGRGIAMPMTGETGSFWFFGPDNVELVLKVLDGRVINDHFWVYYASLSNVRYTVKVTDTVTGGTATYLNPSRRLASVADAWALPASVADHRFRIEEGQAAAGAPVTSRKAPSRQTCTPTPTSLCLEGGRFRAEVAWTDFQDRHGDGQAVPLTDRSGYFWFFDEASVELVLKVLDGRPLNGRRWVFFGALTNVGYSIEVTDTVTGKIVAYFNAPGQLTSFADVQSFTD